MTDKKREEVWQMGRVIPNEPNNRFERTDVEPVKICHSKHQNTDMAWEVDHIFPEQILKELGVPQELIDDNRNLRPLHHSNNESKGTLYPYYTKIKNWDNTAQANIDCSIDVHVSADKQNDLQKLYAPYLNGRTLVDIARAYNMK